MHNSSKGPAPSSSRLGVLRTAGLVLAATVLVSCGRSDTAGKSAGDFEIDERYERGPMALSVKVTKKEITIAERVTLVLQAEVDEDYEVELPKFGEKLEQFGIVDYEAPLAVLAPGGRTRHQRSYVLEPFLSGEYKIPPMKVRFWKKGEEPPDVHEIESDELTVTVKSILPEDCKKLEIRDIAGPVALPTEKARWVPAAVVGGMAVVAGGVAFLSWLRRRRRAAAEVPKIAAHELAYRQLEKLVSEKLIEAGRIKLFYQGISDIVRHYIENRFGLRAPELTTEEFLAELATSDALRPGHKSLLKTFLKHCDMVKFAEHEPSTAEIQQTFDSCKALIEGTASDEATVPVQAAA